MNKNQQGLLEGDNLLNQIVNISKAGAYDVMADQVKELQEKNKALAQALSRLVHTLETDDLRPIPDLIKESKTALKKNNEIRKF